MSTAHFLSLRVTQQTTVLCFVFIGTAPLAAFINALGLVGDMEWLRLPCFNGF